MVFKLKPDRKSTTKERMDKVDAYFKLDPKVRSKIRKKKYDSLSDTQKKTLQGIKTAAEVASYFTPGIGLRLAVPVMRGIQAAKTGFKVGNKTYKTLKEATDAKNKLKKVVPSKIKTRDPKTGKLKPTPDDKATTEATKQLKAKTTRNLTAQQKALKTKQDQTTKNLKAAANISTAGGTVLAGKKLTENKNKKPTKKDSVLSRKRNIDTRRSPGALGGRVEITKKSPAKLKLNNPDDFAKDIKKNKKNSPKLKLNNPDDFAKDIKKDKKSPAKVTKKVEKGPAKSVAEAQKRGLSTFTNKAGKKLAAVNKEQLDKSGLSLRDYLNKQKGLTRKNSTTKKKAGGKVFRRGGGKALRGFGKATYSNKMY
jgi:hypothetical protein